MLQKSKRLSTKTFKEVIDKGKSFHDAFFIIRLIKTSKVSQISVSVPKKTEKLATSRNKIRRQIFSILKDIKTGFAPGYAIVIITKPEIKKIKFAELEKEIKNSFVKLNILK